MKLFFDADVQRSLRKVLPAEAVVDRDSSGHIVVLSTQSFSLLITADGRDTITKQQYLLYFLAAVKAVCPTNDMPVEEQSRLLEVC